MEGQGIKVPPLVTALCLLYEYRFIFVCNLGLVEITEWDGITACDCWTQTSWQVMQRDSDTADSGKPRIVISVFVRKMLGTRYGPVGTRFSLILGTRFSILETRIGP